MSQDAYKQAARQLPSADEQARVILGVTPDAFSDSFVEIERDGTITAWNTRAQYTFGWPGLSAIGENIFDLLFPVNSPVASAQAVREILDSGKELPRIPLKAVAVRRDGSELPCELSFCQTRCGDAVRWGILARDLSREDEIEQETERRYRALLDQISVPFVEVDLKGNYVFANTAYYATYQVPNRTGVSYKQVMDATALAECRETYTRVFQTGLPARHEYPHTFADGRCIFIENFVSVRRNAAGEAIGFVSINHDCTERKQYETELAKAREAAEAASRSKSEFLANMSHEIRTPLNGVVGMLELARCTELNDEQRELLGIARDSANSLLVVLNDILDFSKIEAGRLDLESMEFDLQETVTGAIRTMAVHAHEKRLELAYDIAPELPELICGDPTRLRQVLINLIGNAIKFTEHGEVILRVETAGGPVVDAQVRLKFSVSDTGIGIPLPKQKTIFDAFSQADVSTTRKYGGTGLGLAICSRIVRLMGGQIGVESEAGAGSNFWFTAVFAPAPASKSQVRAVHNTPLTNVPVLIVDDNATNRRILHSLLFGCGALPITAESGLAALQIISQAVANGLPIRLALVDLHMPEMNGFELVEQILRTTGGSCASIMMLTSDDYHATVQRCRELGLTAHLIKPVKKSELLEAACAALQPGGCVAARPEAMADLHVSGTAPLRILLAEDNLVNQKLALRLLQKLGHVLTIASNGREALEKLEQHAFDLVLMDVQMPEMDGFAAVAAIRHKERGTDLHIPIIAMTARAMRGDRQLCLDAGMDDYIIKPIDIKQLSQTIVRTMSRRPENGGSPAPTPLA